MGEIKETKVKTLNMLGYKRMPQDKYMLWWRKIDDNLEKRIEFNGKRWKMYDYYTDNGMMIYTRFNKKERLAIETYEEYYKGLLVECGNVNL